MNSDVLAKAINLTGRRIVYYHPVTRLWVTCIEATHTIALADPQPLLVQACSSVSNVALVSNEALLAHQAYFCKLPPKSIVICKLDVALAVANHPDNAQLVVLSPLESRDVGLHSVCFGFRLHTIKRDNDEAEEGMVADDDDDEDMQDTDTRMTHLALATADPESSSSCT